MPRPLNPRQTRFVEELARGARPSEAATRAGYAPRSGYEFAKRPWCRDALADLSARRLPDALRDSIFVLDDTLHHSRSETRRVAAALGLVQVAHNADVGELRALARSLIRSATREEVAA